MQPDHSAPQRTPLPERRGYRRPPFSGPSFAQPGERGDLFAYGGFLDGGVPLDGPFAIIDLETSALSPTQGRVLEIAITRVDRHGTVLDEMSSLIDPGDGIVGAEHIHQISAPMLAGAPCFADLADTILKLLAGSIVVAHNAAFEDRWLGSELARMGLTLPHLPTLDTLWLVRQLRKLPDFKLGTVVQAYGCTLADAHTASGDVRALTALLPRMLDDAGPLQYPVGPPPLPQLSHPSRPAKPRSSGP